VRIGGGTNPRFLEGTCVEGAAEELPRP
jgi:hypothetical protein